MGWFLAALRSVFGLVFYAAVIVGLASAIAAIAFPGLVPNALRYFVVSLFAAVISLRLNSILVFGEEGMSAFDQR
ncbi:hypothetical protein [Halococcus sp. PRR34]|uniref:hypothetical protein n=1 Tax=Halococcus sp. PRR34 TaxID=3020830 RepID=UPI00235FF66E|nr:hypothetical protein [Halococcus sp. PRR34]